MEDEGAGEEVVGNGTGSMNRRERIEMRVAGKTMMMLLIASLVLIPMAGAQNTGTEMSLWQARRALKEYILTEGGPYGYKKDPNSIRLTEEKFEYDDLAKKPHHFVIDLIHVGRVTLSCPKKDVCNLKNTEGKKNTAALPPLFWYDYKQPFFPLTTPDTFCSPECKRQANAFTGALNELSAFAVDVNNPLHNFPAHAATWRALATKPALPDTVRVRRMMAEDALKNKKPEDALRYYEQGIESYSMWPEGWFNAALVAGELGEYPQAVEFIQNYLELVPDAKDAQSARDQLEIWKIKAQENK
jgi:tetratricopeptide (TPR) repeat protein